MTGDGVTEALWQKVCEDLSADKAHEAFITHCRMEGLLADAARRYRERKATLGAEETEAREAIDKRLSAIAIIAMSEIDLHRSTPRKSNLMLILKIVAVVLGLSAAAYTLIQLMTLQLWSP